MAYGHTRLFFATAAEAQAYLDSCRASMNYTAENYQDRVAAQRCIRQAADWSPPPIKEFSREEIAASRRRLSA